MSKVNKQITSDAAHPSDTADGLFLTHALHTQSHLQYSWGTNVSAPFYKKETEAEAEMWTDP